MEINPIRKAINFLFHRNPAASVKIAGPRSGAQVFNFLWLNLDLPAKPDPADGSIRQPLPPKYIENVRKAGADNPGTDIVLWVDSQRLTNRQMEFLRHATEQDRPNVRLKDLRAIPAYDKEALYNEGETDPNWRGGGQSTVIWRQVDAAKILVSLQGNYDQSFFADLDHAHLGINSEPVQAMLGQHEIMIGSSWGGGCSVENQLWGFARSRRKFFETYYTDALKAAYAGDNAYYALIKKQRSELQEKESIPLKEYCLPIDYDGTRAEQPGHAWRKGWGEDQAVPETVASEELARVFNARRGDAAPVTDAGLPLTAENTARPPQAANTARPPQAVNANLPPPQPAAQEFNAGLW